MSFYPISKRNRGKKYRESQEEVRWLRALSKCSLLYPMCAVCDFLNTDWHLFRTWIYQRQWWNILLSKCKWIMRPALQQDLPGQNEHSCGPLACLKSRSVASRLLVSILQMTDEKKRLWFDQGYPSKCQGRTCSYPGTGLHGCHES